MSWDVLLLRFRNRDAVPFDVDAARRIVLSTEGVHETEPFVAEITSDGIADVYFHGRSPEILFTVHASSPAVTRLMYELARELEMFAFFPLREGWGAAVVEEAARQELPDRAWSGWQIFDEDFDPPEPVVCRNAADLDAALAGSYGEWAEWAHGPGWA